MDDINRSYPPCKVVSIDHTFNVNKRTTVFATGPPPEKRATSEPNKVKHVSIKENAVLMTIGVNGQVNISYLNCLLEYYLIKPYAVLVLICV